MKPPDRDPLSIAGIRERCETNTKNIAFGFRAAGGAFKLPAVIVVLCLIAATALSALLIRQRMGLAYAGLGWSLLFWSMGFGYPFVPEGPAQTIVSVWMLGATMAFFVHLAAGLVRFFRPGAEHVHRFSMGEPAWFIQPLWRMTMRSWAENPLRVALIGEPLLLLTIAGAFFLYDRVIANSPEEVTHLGWLALASAAGIFIQSALVALRNLRQLALISDQEHEQSALAEGLSQRPSPGADRQPEGFIDLNN